MLKQIGRKMPTDGTPRSQCHPPRDCSGTVSSRAAAMARRPFRSGLGWRTMVALVLLMQGLAGCEEKWKAHEYDERDADLEAAFFAGLDTSEIADVPEARSLRPCCIFGNDVAVQGGSMPGPRSRGSHGVLATGPGAAQH